MDPQNPSANDVNSGFGIEELLAMLRKQRLVMAGVLGAVVLLTLVVTLVITPSYKATAVMHIKLPTGAQEISTDGEPGFSGFRGKFDVYFETQLEIIESGALLSEVLERYRALGVEDEHISSLNALRKNVSVSLRKGTELVDVSVLHPVPERAAMLANLLTEVYQEHNLSGTRDAAHSARVWLEEQLHEYDDRLDQLNEAIFNYQTEHDLADADQLVSALSAEVETLKQRHAEVRADIIQLEARVQAHERLLRAGAFDELAKHMDTPMVQALTESYAKAVVDMVGIASRYGERHPDRIAKEAMFQRLTEELEREVRRTVEGEKATLKVLRSNADQLRKDIISGNQLLLDKQRVRDGYDRLRANIDRSKEYKVRLSQRKDELDLVARTQLNNARVVQAASPPLKAHSPKLSLNLILGFLFGSVLAGVVAVVRDLFDDTVSSSLDVTAHLRTEFLGSVPKTPSKVPVQGWELALYNHTHPQSLVAESIRAVRAMLEFGSTDRHLRRLMVTSAVVAEGKTTTSARLAVAFARSGRKVLLIDADLRSPRQHRVFNQEDRDPGLSDVLTGAKELSDVIRSTTVPNVDLLTAGAGGLRVAESLGSDAMEQVLRLAEERYDLIVIDTPPLLLTADPTVISQFADAVVMVVRAHAASRRLARRGIVMLEQVGAPLRGVVLNAADARSEAASAYYGYKYGRYGYGYGYGQGYGDAEEEAPIILDDEPPRQDHVG